VQFFLRFGFILLLIAGGLLSPVSAHDFHKVKQSLLATEASISADLYQVNGTESLLDDLQLTQHQSSSKKAVKDHKDDSKFVPLISQRLLSFAQHGSLHNQPDYVLAFEFTIPPVPSLTIGYRIDFAQTLDWSLHMGQTPSRLSGWKETNLLYRFSQTISLS
jgi:hypothetical protein